MQTSMIKNLNLIAVESDVTLFLNGGNVSHVMKELQQIDRMVFIATTVCNRQLKYVTEREIPYYEGTLELTHIPSDAPVSLHANEELFNSCKNICRICGKRTENAYEGTILRYDKTTMLGDFIRKLDIL